MKSIKYFAVSAAVLGLVLGSQARAMNLGVGTSTDARVRSSVGLTASTNVKDSASVNADIVQTFREKREAVVQIVREQKEVAKDFWEGKREDRKRESTEENRKHHIAKAWAGIKNRLEAIIKRQHHLVGRIDRWLNKASEAGRNVVDLRARLAAADKLITAAEVQLKESGAKIRAILDSSDTSVNMLAQVKVQIQLAIETVRASHKALVDIVLHIKSTGPLPPTIPNPTPSVTIHPSPTPTP